MNATAAVGIGIVAIFSVVLAILTFRPPDNPRLSRLLFFQLFLASLAVLGYFFLVRVYKWNPNPFRVDGARWLTKDRMIYLGDIIPGLYDLDYIERIDTDHADEEIEEEWLAFYQYDVRVPEEGKPQGPFGAAIYDQDYCRPPAILSYELVPVSYDYLAQQKVSAEVENIIAYKDPVSANEDRPEVIVKGATRDVVTDLNIFRKVGVALDCFEMQQWRATHSGAAFPNPLRYDNIGSFRGNYQVRRNGSTVTVINSAGFERSQFVVQRMYRPENGSYFRAGTQELLPAVETSLAFASGLPDEVTQVYYPEKSVLAFYLNLGKDQKALEQAESYLSPEAQQFYNIKTDPFGLSTAETSLARARDKLARVLVWEIRYEPDVEAEQQHKNRQVQVTLAGVNEAGEIDYAHPCQVTWTVIGEERAGALPYNCEWRLDRYQSTCSP